MQDQYVPATGTMSTATFTQTPKNDAVHQAIESLGLQLTGLVEDLTTLHGRLEPVMTPQPPQPGGDDPTSAPRAPSSDVAARIASLTDLLVAARQGIGNALHRLEV